MKTTLYSLQKFSPRWLLAWIVISFSLPGSSASPAPLPAAEMAAAEMAAAEAVFLVDTLLDQPDSDPADGACATAAGTCSLRAAVMQANFDTQPNTITLPAGVYSLTRAGSDDTALLGDLDISADLAIQGAGPGASIIDGNRAVTADRVFHILGTAVSVRLRGLTIRGGQAPNSITLLSERGGGLVRDGLPNQVGRSLALEQVVVEDNQALVGGGLYVTVGQVTLKDSQLRRNQATSTGGGAFVAGSALSLLDSQVYSNTAASGGGLYVVDIAASQIAHSQLYANTASLDGGAIATQISSQAPAGSRLVIRDSRLYHNRAGQDGGAILGGPLTLQRTLVEANTATRGGGLALQSRGLTHIDQSAILDNTALDGGGVLFYNLSAEPDRRLLIDNTTLSGNTATRHGAGIYAEGAGGAWLTNVTIAGNRLNPGFPIPHPVDGGGVVITATANLTIENTLIANNLVDNGNSLPVENNCAGRLLRSLGNNLLETPDCAISGTSFGNITGQDPRLGLLQLNGGATPSLALLPGSPAIDAVAIGTCPAVDQRGVARPFDGDGDGTPRCDIGAYERASGLSQSIDFPALPDLPLIDGSRTITATASSGLQVVFSVQTPAACAVSAAQLDAGVTSATLTPLAAGACTLLAQQPGSDTFAPAAPITRTFQVIASDPVLPVIYLPVVVR